MADVNEMIKTREEYVSLIKKELLGPGSEISIPDAEHELITNSPDVRYSIGILFPKDNKINADNGDSARVEESALDTEYEEESETENSLPRSSDKTSSTVMADEENLDEEIGLAAQNMPSSMGITFFAHGESAIVNCLIKFATYKHAKAEDCLLPKIEEGDILAVLSTGAYNYSMASNYNRNFIPPVIMVKDGQSRYVVKPQTFEDLTRNDL